MSQPKELAELQALCVRIIRIAMLPTNTTKVNLNIKLKWGEGIEYDASLSICRKVFTPNIHHPRSTSDMVVDIHDHRTTSSPIKGHGNTSDSAGKALDETNV